MRGLLVVFILSIAVMYITFLATAPIDLGDNYSAVEDVVVTEVDDDMSLVTFSSGGGYLNMYVSAEQGYSIGMALAGIRATRPMTHDLQVDILWATNTRILAVSIDSFTENYFTATLFIRAGPFLSTIDCRPSDCTALALRTGAPIYIHQNLLLGSVYDHENITDIIVA